MDGSRDNYWDETERLINQMPSEDTTPQGSGSKASSGTDVSRLLDRMRGATESQESGGRQRVRNARTDATGLFQVMPANIRPWTKKYYGRGLSQEEFANNRDAQIAVFNGEMGRYLRKGLQMSGGDEDTAIRMAAAGWYGGEGRMKQYDNAKRFRANEPSFREYTTSVLRKTKGRNIESEEAEYNAILAELDKDLKISEDREYDAILKELNTDIGAYARETDKLINDPSAFTGSSPFNQPANVSPTVPVQGTTPAVTAETPQVPNQPNTPMVQPQTPVSPQSVQEGISAPQSVNGIQTPPQASQSPQEGNLPNNSDVEVLDETYDEFGNLIDDTGQVIKANPDAQGRSAFSQTEPVKVVFDTNPNADYEEKKSQVFNAILNRVSEATYDDLEEFFKQNGWKDLQTGKQVSDWNAKWGRFEASPEDLDRIREFVKTSRDNFDRDVAIKTGIILEPDKKSKEEIQALLNASDEYNYQLAQTENVIRDYTEIEQSPVLGRLRYFRDQGLLTDDEYAQAVDKERELIRQEQFRLKQNAQDPFNVAGGANKKSYAYSDADTISKQKQLMNEAWARREREVIERFGSFTAEEEYYKDLYEKYKWRPLVRPYEAVRTFTRELPKMLSSAVLRTTGMVDEVNPISVDNIYGYITEGKQVDKSTARLLADAIDATLDSWLPSNPDFQEDFMTQVAPQVFAQVLVQIGAGVLTGGATVPTLIGATSGASGQIKEAENAGADKGTQALAGIVGGIAAIPDALPLSKFLAPLNKAGKETFVQNLLSSVFRSVSQEAGEKAGAEAVKGTIGKILANLKTVGSGALFEGLQEVSENKINDALAKATYDPKRKVLTITDEDIASFWGGALGGAVGGAVQIKLQANADEQTNAIDTEIERIRDELFAQMQEQTKQSQEIPQSENQDTQIPQEAEPNLNDTATQDTALQTETEVSESSPQVDEKPLVQNQQGEGDVETDAVPRKLDKPATSGAFPSKQEIEARKRQTEQVEQTEQSERFEQAEQDSQTPFMVRTLPADGKRRIDIDGDVYTLERETEKFVFLKNAQGKQKRFKKEDFIQEYNQQNPLRSWQDVVDAQEYDGQKQDILRRVGENGSQSELNNVLDMLSDETVADRPNIAWAVANNPNASEAIKQRALRLREDLMRPESTEGDSVMKSVVQDFDKQAFIEEYNQAVADRDRVKAQHLVNQFSGIQFKSSEIDRGEGIHAPADPFSGAPAWDLNYNGIYPSDVYSGQGLRYYGTGEDAMDSEAWSLLLDLKGNPNRQIKIYRAVEKDSDAKGIRPGDWVTPIRRYAVDHGRSALNNTYKILSKTVAARDIFTAGDSWLEWGYHPQEQYPRSFMAHYSLEKDKWGIRKMLKDERGRPVLKTAEERFGDSVMKSVASNIEQEWDSEEYRQRRDSIPLAQNEKGELLAPNGSVSKIQNKDQWRTVRTPEFKKWFGDWENDPENASKVVDENGEPLVVYHGTPSMTFDAFNREQFFSPDPDYASRYISTSASSSSFNKGIQENAPGVLPVFLNVRKLFDTRKPQDADLFNSQYYYKFGQGSPLTERGLPDWVEARDLAEFLQDEINSDFDGMILDEGGDEAGLRPFSYVAFNPNQIKSLYNQGSFNPNEDSILRKARDPQSESKLKDLQTAFTPDLAPNITATVKNNGEIEISEEASEYIRRNLSELESDTGQAFEGAFLTPSNVNSLVSVMEKNLADAEQNGYTKEELKPFRDLIKTISDVTASEGSNVLYVFDDALPEERFHRASYMASGGKSIHNRLPKNVVNEIAEIAKDNPRFQREYGQASKDVQAEEFVVKLITGQAGKYGYTKADRAKLNKAVDLWTNGFIEANPDADLSYFDEKYGKYIKQKAQAKAQNQKSDEGRVNNPSGAKQTRTSNSDETEGDVSGEDKQASGRVDVSEGSTKLKESKLPKSAQAVGLPVASRLYVPDSNLKQLQEVDAIFDEGVEEADAEFRRRAKRGDFSGTTSALGVSLMMHYGQNGQLDKLNEISEQVVPYATKAGQAVQALSILSMYDPTSAGSFASKYKQQRTGKPLTQAEQDKAVELAKDYSVNAEQLEVTDRAISQGKQTSRAIKEEEKATARASSDKFINEKDENLELEGLAKELAKVREALKKQQSKTQYYKRKSEGKTGKPKTASGVTVDDVPSKRSKKTLLAKEQALRAKVAKYFGTPVMKSLNEIMRMVAWHASPFLFDKFSTDAIGTGEGAQAYGWGLYFASVEEVADWYRNAGESGVLINGKSLAQRKRFQNLDDDVKSEVHEILDQVARGDLSKSKLFGYAAYMQGTWLTAYNFIRDAKSVELSKGHKYKVDLKPSEDEYLLWDKPLSEQSEKVQNALSEFYADNVEELDEITGEQLYKHIAVSQDSNEDRVEYGASSGYGSQRLASLSLKDLGIRGIKYLDGTSRNKGEGSYNYVIFDDADIEITEVMKSVAGKPIELDPDVREALTDLTALEYIKGTPFPEVMVALNAMTSGQVENQVLRDIHADAIDTVTESSDLSKQDRALQNIRAQHTRNAQKHRELPIFTFNETLRDLSGVKSDWKALDKYAYSILKTGFENGYSDEAVWSALARKRYELDDILPNLRKEYPNLDKQGQLTAIRESEQLYQEARKRLTEDKFQHKYAFRMNDTDVKRLQEERRVHTRNTQKTTRQMNSFYNALTKTKTEVALETAVNFRRANLLTGIRTHERNLIGNFIFQLGEEASRLISTPVDAAIAKKTGQRTTTLSPKSVASGFKALFKDDDVLLNTDYETGIKMAKNILLYGDTVENLSKNNLMESNIQNTFDNKAAKFADVYINGVFRALSASDALFKVYTVRKSLEEQSKLQAKNEGLKGEEYDERWKELLADPSEVFKINAQADAEFVTFQNDNELSKAIRKFKQVHPSIKTTTDIVVPFERTPTNIVLRVLDYSPVGFIRASGQYRTWSKASDESMKEINNLYREAVENDFINPEFSELSKEEQLEKIDEALKSIFNRRQQQMFARTIGRAGLGTAMYVLGGFLAASGILAGSMSPDDDDKRETSEFFGRMKLGINNGSIRLPGIGRFSLPDDPFSKSLINGATAYEQMKLREQAGKSPVMAVVNAFLETSKNTAFEQPLVSNFDGLYDVFAKGRPGQYAGNLAGSAIPTIFADVGEAIDPKSRKSSGYDPNQPKERDTTEGWARYQWRGFRNSFFKRVPIARQYLVDESDYVPPKGGAGWRALSVLQPFKLQADVPYQAGSATRDQKINEARKEISDIQKALPALEGETKEQAEKDLDRAKKNLAKYEKERQSPELPKLERRKKELDTQILKLRRDIRKPDLSAKEKAEIKKQGQKAVDERTKVSKQIEDLKNARPMPRMPYDSIENPTADDTKYEITRIRREITKNRKFIADSSKQEGDKAVRRKENTDYKKKEIELLKKLQEMGIELSDKNKQILQGANN